MHGGLLTGRFENRSLKLYGKATDAFTLTEDQVEELRKLLRQHKLHEAFKFRLNIYKMRGEIDGNTDEFLDVLNFYKKKGVITANQRRSLENDILFQTTLIIPPPYINSLSRISVSLSCSKKSSNRLLSEVKKNQNNISLSFHMNGISGVFKFFSKILRKYGLLKSKKNSKIFLQALKKVRLANNINSSEYQSIRKYVLAARPIHVPIRNENDHFPPDDLYRFAKDKSIKNIAFANRPTWRISRGKHRRAISSATDNIGITFRKNQRVHFYNGEYAIAIQNYLKKYIDDRILIKENYPLMINTLKKCVKVKLLNHRQFEDCLILLGEKDRSRYFNF